MPLPISEGLNKIRFALTNILLGPNFQSSKEEVFDARQSHWGSFRREEKLSTAQGVQEIGSREERQRFQRGAKKPAGVLGEGRQRAGVVQAVEKGFGMEISLG